MSMLPDLFGLVGYSENAERQEGPENIKPSK